MATDEHPVYSASIRLGELVALSLSWRQAAVLGVWTGTFLGSFWAFSGREGAQAATAIAGLFWLIYWPLMRAQVGDPHSPCTGSISLDQDGNLRVRWNWVTHRWRRFQWFERKDGVGSVFVIRWPWCLFVTYSVFPGPPD